MNRSGNVYAFRNRIAIAIDCTNDPASKAGHTIEYRWSCKAKMQGNSMDERPSHSARLSLRLLDQYREESFQYRSYAKLALWYEIPLNGPDFEWYYTI